MFELSGTHFERGVFELRLTNDAPFFRRWPVMLGPIRGRMVALTLFILASFLTFYRQPGSYLMQRGLVHSSFTAAHIQQVVTWGLMAIGLALYISVFVFRAETLNLTFDRSKLQIHFEKSSPINHMPAVQGIIPFSDLIEFRVAGPASSPGTPHGYVELKAKQSDGKPRTFQFKVLSAEQLIYFPLNLSKIIDREPTGDWKDPEL